MIKKVSSGKWKIILITTAGIVAFLFLTSTTFKTPEIKGVVTDAETGQPIADARIYAKWMRRMRGFGGKYSAGIEKELRLKTSADGTFLLPAHTLFNFIPSPIGMGGDFFMMVFAHGYKNLKFYFFKTTDFESRRPRYEEFQEVIKGTRILFRMSKIQDPKTFLKNWGEVFLTARPDKEFEMKEDQLFVEKFGKQKWSDEYIQYELAEAYYRLGDYKLALKKLDEILETDSTRKTKYFEDKYRKYRLKLNGKK